MIRRSINVVIGLQATT